MLPANIEAVRNAARSRWKPPAAAAAAEVPLWPLTRPMPLLRLMPLRLPLAVARARVARVRERLGEGPLFGSGEWHRPTHRFPRAYSRSVCSA